MMTKRWIAAAALAAAVGVTSAPCGLSKPPDLPADPRVACAEWAEQPGHGELRLGFGLSTRGLEVEIELVRPAKAEVAPALDTTTPALVPMFIQNLGYFIRSAEQRTGEVADPARRLFDEGERCWACGDIAEARRRYQEAHLESPTTHFGQRAVQRLLELDMEQGASEEQEAPPRAKPAGDEAFRRMRSETQPLGTVGVPTY